MHLFFSAELNETVFSLPSEEAHHLIHVLRLNTGDKVNVTDGKGTLADCEITHLTKKTADLHVLSKKVFPEPARRLHLAMAPTKNIDRFEWFVEKATEVGVAAITPLLCSHSERKVVNMERIRKVVIAAAKQSQSYWFPVLNELTAFNQLVLKERISKRFIAHCSEGPKENLSALVQLDEALILIGPEGDFSPAELTLAREHGFSPLSLGEKRLRTETAGLVAVTAFNLK